MTNTPLHSFQARAEALKALHERKGIFVIPNPWDVGSARVLETFGFEALATSSSSLAFALGKPDGHASIGREETLRHIRQLATATTLPISADLTNGYGDEPEACAETILRAAGAGMSGGSIEDATGKPADPIYPFALSVQRVKAAVAAARSLPYPFTLTARAENLIHGRPDLPDTIRRLEAFADAGADVLFAPGLKTRLEVEAVVKAVAPRPVNVVMGLTGSSLTLRELEDLGVKRVSLGSAFIRTAYGAFFRAAEEILQQGTFGFAKEAKPFSDINKLFQSFE